MVLYIDSPCANTSIVVVTLLHLGLCNTHTHTHAVTTVARSCGVSTRNSVRQKKSLKLGYSEEYIG